MAQIVLIDQGTLRDGVSLGDLIAVHDDNVVLGPAYSTYKVIKVNATVAQVEAGIQALEANRTGSQTSKYSINASDVTGTGTISRTSFLSGIKLNG